jgi:hypothetical protein
VEINVLNPSNSVPQTRDGFPRTDVDVVLMLMLMMMLMMLMLTIRLLDDE